MLNILKKWKNRLFIITVFVMGLSLAGCGVKQDDALQEISVSEDSAAGNGGQNAETSGADGKEAGSGHEAGTDEGKGSNSTESDPLDSGISADPEGSVFVYVCGAVKKPGVYELEEGSRVFEAVKLAGGVTEDAAPEMIDQARYVTDGETIYMPAESEIGENSRNMIREQSSGPVFGDGGKEKININTAGKEELMTLTGIGEAKAQSILDYREENGGFQSIEELMEISGIKEGVFNKIKDEITI